VKIIDAGHVYQLTNLDDFIGDKFPQTLTFVKRSGANFPFNEGDHPGTNVQEVLRALIDRTDYLNRQKPCAETEAAAGCLRAALVLYEQRAARRHERFLSLPSTQHYVCAPTCAKCGHIGCGCAAETGRAAADARSRQVLAMMLDSLPNGNAGAD
jgi:hypothetical protein